MGHLTLYSKDGYIYLDIPVDGMGMYSPVIDEDFTLDQAKALVKANLAILQNTGELLSIIAPQNDIGRIINAFTLFDITYSDMDKEKKRLAILEVLGC